MIAAVLVVALGGSLTAGYDLPDPPTQNYAARYAQRVHGKLVNLAEPGAQCDMVTEHQVPQMPPGASIVILECGTNDVGGYGYSTEGKPDGRVRTPPANDEELAAAQIDFAILIHHIRTREPHATIYVVNLRHWQRMTGPEDAQFAYDINAWNTELTLWDLCVVDVGGDPRMYDSTYIFPDLLHPNAQGNVEIADDFLKVQVRRGPDDRRAGDRAANETCAPPP